MGWMQLGCEMGREMSECTVQWMVGRKMNKAGWWKHISSISMVSMCSAFLQQSSYIAHAIYLQTWNWFQVTIKIYSNRRLHTSPDIVGFGRHRSELMFCSQRAPNYQRPDPRLNPVRWSPEPWRVSGRVCSYRLEKEANLLSKNWWNLTDRRLTLSLSTTRGWW